MSGAAPYRSAAHGLEKCPHCERLTKPQKSKGLRWVCGACRGPVVPGVDATKLDAETTRLLRETADFATLRAATRRQSRPAALLVLGGAGFVALSVREIDVQKPYLLAAVLSAVFAIAFFSLISPMLSEEHRHRAAREQLNAAWVGAARTLIDSFGGHITAKELASTTSITVDEAEEILARLATVAGRVDVDRNAELHYRVAAGDESKAFEDDDANERSRRRQGH